MSEIKPLVIKVQEKSIPAGVEYKWGSLTDQMSTFTKNIITSDIGNNDGSSAVNIGTIVSGMPTIFARANLFKLSLDYITDNDAAQLGLLGYYKALIDEWRGLIAAIALDYANFEVERVFLTYSDNKSVLDTRNLYEPKGAFGNVLFNRKPLWSEQGLARNDDAKPFVDVLLYKGKLVGGTSPDSFLFTSVAYRLEGTAPFIKNGKFANPLNADLTPDQLLQLHGYIAYIISQINRFSEYFNQLEARLRPQTANIYANLSNWLYEMERKAQNNGIRLSESSAPPVDLFKTPFSILFNYSTILYGSEGLIAENTEGIQNPIAFDPRKLFLPRDSEIACINFGNVAAQEENFIVKQPIILMRAITKNMPGFYHYFALPLSPLGLNVFGRTLGSLVGMDEHSAIRSRLSAEYDPSISTNNLKVKLTLYTSNDRVRALEEVYTVSQKPISGLDILIWPNFISKQWSRYFMYSEMPHNTSSPTCPFKATPFVGDVNDDFFRILFDKNDPYFLAKDGQINSEKNDKVSASLQVVSDNRVADNKYKYEIYESNQPFKGVRLAYANRESGYIVIRYSTNTIDGLPNNYLQLNRNLQPAHLGIDFGSTNSSVAYFSRERNDVVDEIIMTNKRVSLFSSNEIDNNKKTAKEEEIFFFQNDFVKSNSIKSVLTLHDQQRLNIGTFGANISKIVSSSVRGGFPCFEKNLPIESATENRYRLTYNRVGQAELVHNMKWSTQDLENAYKRAYLGSLLLHVYAQLFEDNHVPVTLKWSYPSSMGRQMVIEYNDIWSQLVEENPIVGGSRLEIFRPNTSIDINHTSGNKKVVEVADEWSLLKNSPQFKEIKAKEEPFKFNFNVLENNECLTEACAVANYFVNQNQIETTENYLTLCFDVGGSTTDISALCKMMGPNGPGLAMIKQNSIRFAAQRISNATSISTNFKAVLLEICDRKRFQVQGLNVEPIKYSSKTAPYYFEQIVDRLEEENDFILFYEQIRSKCPELMSINAYVTGLIMYYAGQISSKLIKEINLSEDKFTTMDNWRPKVNVVFSGKGARIFDWFKSVEPRVANDYYVNLFYSGFGGIEQAKIRLAGPPNINPTNRNGSKNIKYEVSKGLAYPTDRLLVTKNPEAIEILGEEGFVLVNKMGEKEYLPFDASITKEMMEHVGTYFLSSPESQQLPCPKFSEFANIFFQVAQPLFGLKMTENDFMNGFKEMNINSYIKTLPEYYAAQQSYREGKTSEFDFVAPIIILEGMKFYDDFLLKRV